MSPSFPRYAKPAALVLAVACATQVVAQEEIVIPGMNMPVAASTIKATSKQPESAAEASTAAQLQSSPPAQAAAISQPTAQQKTAQEASQEVDHGKSAPKGRLVSVKPGDNENPAVPASVVQKRVEAVPVETRQDVVVTSGTNTLIPISKGQINRIVTPFENPHIQTVSQAEISSRGNVIYVTSDSDQPVTMFVTPADDEGVAISLTLLPQAIPPIQANLILSKSVQGLASGMPVPQSQAYSGQARKWERSQPYMDTLRAIMRDIALGKLPKGYSMSQLTNGARIPACAQPNIRFDFSGSQLIEGHDFRVFVGTAENISARTLELDLGSCSHPHRAAVSSWPLEVLEPGEKTEVYVVTRVPQEVPQGSTRPSLLK